MDLYAYMQIEDYESILKENNIEIPRLRGIRLMKEEQPISKEEIKATEKAYSIDVLLDLCRSCPCWTTTKCWGYTKATEKRVSYYTVSKTDENGDTTYTDIRWDRIHGKKKKVLKMAIKKTIKNVRTQMNTWNKYVGKENIIYIHARIGGPNWVYYGGIEISREPWFLEKVDDLYDNTYCDIYVKIK